MKAPRLKLLPLLAGLVAAASLVITVPSAPAASAADGTLWAPVRATFYDHEYLSAFPDGTVYSTNDTGYSRSVDFGVTQVPMPPPDPLVSAWSNIRFGTPEVGYAISESSHYGGPCGPDRPRIWKTSDAGLLWSQVCLPAVPAGYRFKTWPFGWSLAVADGGAGVVVFGDEVESPADPIVPPGVCFDHKSVAYLSSDGGTTWQRFVLGGAEVMPAYTHHMNSPTSAYFVTYDMAPVFPCSNGEPQTRVGTSQRVLHLDAATGVRTVLTCARPGPLCSSVYAVTPSRLFVGRTDASTKVSTDGGATWSDGQSLRGPRGIPALDSAPVNPAEIWVQGFDFVDALHGFASTNGYGTWRTTDGGATWVQERSHECEHRAGAGADVEAATAERAVVAGPGLMSTRVPGLLLPAGCESIRISDGGPEDWIEQMTPFEYRVTVGGVVRVQASVS